MSKPKCPNDMLYTHYRRLLPNYSEIVSKNQALHQESDLAAIREEYQRYKYLPSYRRSLLFRRLYSTLAISSFVLIWTYGKIERILNYLEYEVYIR
jgi:hypothetical protein